MPIGRANVTLRGVRVQGFFGDPIYSAGIAAFGRRAVIEDCVLIGKRDDFAVPMPPGPQEDSGILIYYQTKERATVRRNVIIGFHGGVFVKCHPGEYLIERNTFINNVGPAVGGSYSARGKHIIARRNLVYGTALPFMPTRVPGATLTIEENCVWASPWVGDAKLKENVACFASGECGPTGQPAEPVRGRDVEADIRDRWYVGPHSFPPSRDHRCAQQQEDAGERVDRVACRPCSGGAGPTPVGWRNHVARVHPSV